MKLRKVIFPILIVLAIAGTLLYLKLRPQVATLRPATASTVPLQTPPPATPTSATTVYKDGSYTGSAVDATYGTVQVQAVVSGGKLTDVKLLQMPNDPGHTTEVTSVAGPQLQQEALTAQSANVDIVSGATQTSQGFIQSLQAALGQAQA